MSFNRRVRLDDFDIEPIEKLNDRGRNKSRTSSSRTRSRSRKRSYSRRTDKDSRSRSPSEEQQRRRHHHHHHHRRGRSSRSSNSRSRSRSRSRGYSRRNDRHRSHKSSKNRDTRSRSYSRSRSKSQSNASILQSERRNQYRNNNSYEDKYRKNSRSRSRSRSRSSSHFRDFGTCSTKKQHQSPNKQSANACSSSSLRMENIHEENQDSKDGYENVEDLPLPDQKSNCNKQTDGIYRFAEDEPIDRERIHREMEEKLRAELAKEGKVYPPPKPEASHPVFANDGSFLEIFKKMQQAQASAATSTALATTSAAIVKPILPAVPAILATANPTTAPFLAAAATGKSAPPPPIVGRRRGGKILKTGVVAKPKVQTETNADPKDFWSLYLAEVNKYKNTACESEQGNRPLVK